MRRIRWLFHSSRFLLSLFVKGIIRMFTDNCLKFRGYLTKLIINNKISAKKINKYIFICVLFIFLY